VLDTMDIFAQLVEKIISEQESIIGPIAVEQAQRVPGLKVNYSKHEISFEGDKSQAIEKLIEIYKELFGQASVEVCKEAVRSIISQIPSDQVPPLLR